MATLKGSYRGVWKVIDRYWRIYGGFHALLRSPFFHVSAVLLVLTVELWWRGPWWNDVTSVLPNLLGFTLGGFAIFLGFGDEKFKEVIAGVGSENASSHSPYLGVSATFLHFVLVQIVALLWAIAAKGLHFDLPWPSVMPYMRALGVIGDIIGYWLFLYGICLAAAAGIGIFRVAGWYDEYQTRRQAKDGRPPSP